MMKNSSELLLDAAHSGDTTTLVRLISEHTFGDVFPALLAAVRTGHTAGVQLLLPLIDPKAHDSQALRLAAEHGHTECVKLLIPVSDPKAKNSYALRWAAAYGHTDIVKLLIPVSDPKANNSIALTEAADQGRTECVKLLIGVSDPEANHSYALRMAAENGHTECVKLLIPVCVSKTKNSLALHAALDGCAWPLSHNHEQCAWLLWDVSDLEHVRQGVVDKHIRHNGAPYSDEQRKRVQEIWYKILAKKQSVALQAAVSHPPTENGHKKSGRRRRLL